MPNKDHIYLQELEDRNDELAELRMELARRAAELLKESEADDSIKEFTKNLIL